MGIADRRVFKYELNQASNALSLPVSSELLHVEMHAGRLWLWAIVDTSHEVEDKTFHVYGTGWNIPKELVLYHVGSVRQDGAYMWHVFVEQDNTKG